MCAALAVTLPACDGGIDSGGDAGVGPGPIDQPTNAAIGVRESEMRAGLLPDIIMVTLPIRPLERGPISGRARVEVFKLGEPEPIGAAEADFESAGEPITVELPVAATIEPGELAALADYVIEYAVDGAAMNDDLWGRRSLLTALAPAEVQLLGPDRFLAGGTGFLRVLSRDPVSGTPKVDTPVSVVLDRGDALDPVELGEGLTDAFGQLTLGISPDDDLLGEGTLRVFVDDPGARQEINALIDVTRATKVMLTTDKPLYQPGQTMHLRALALDRTDRSPAANASVVFEVFDGKDNKVERITTEANPFGIASATFTLAREVNMGTYRIAAIVDDETTEKTVTVERYSLPKFDVDLALDRPVYLAGDALVGTISARYFFRAAVARGTVRVQAATLDAGRTVFAESMGATNAEGLFQFEIRLPDYVVGLPLEQGGGLVELAIELTDTAGQQRTVTRTVRVASAPLEVVVVPQSGEIVPGLPNILRARSTDAAGRPVAADHVLTMGGARFEFATGEDGLGQIEVPIAETTVRVSVASTDGGGNAVENTFDFTAGDGVLDGAVRVRTERALYRVGDTLTVEVDVIGAADAVYIDAVREGQTVLTERLVPDADGRAMYDIELAPDHAGTLQIDAYYLALGSSIRRDHAIVYVDTASDLEIAIEADREVYAPADEATLSVTVTDGDGNGRPTALGIQIVDEAVFSLMEFRPGLEKIYFLIEEALATPGHQIGVPGLATLTGRAGAADDETTQTEAAMLFDTTGGITAHPVSVNTHVRRVEAVPGVIRPWVDDWATDYIRTLRGAQDAEQNGVDDEALAARVAADAGRLADPWGQRWSLSIVGDALLIQTRGPDELPDTADDIELDFHVECDVFALCGAAEGEGEGEAEGGPFPAPGDDVAAGNRDNDGMADSGGGPRIRRDFPETLLVEPSLITDGEGRAELVVPLADSITTWRVTALANTLGGDLGSTTSGIRVFQDFFVDLDVPATLTRGDEFTVPVALYNYLDVPQRVRVEVREADWVEVLGATEQIVDLGPNEVRGIALPIRAERVGIHELVVFAYGDQLEDAVARSVRVEPDGEKIETVRSGKLEGLIQQTVTVPLDAVADSGRLFVKLYPGLFSSVVEGLDSILRMPSGCFEQTSSSTWPNGLVMLYMDEADAGTPEIELQASQYVNTGYQRLLTFEVDGGGFEWFGNAPAHEVLTAYGLLEFVDLARVRQIDEQMIARTRAWLLGRQNADGSWEVSSRGLDETGNLNDPITVTAYIGFALAAAGERGEPMERAAAFLAGHSADMGSYTLALYANFLAHFAPDGADTRAALERLAGQIVANIADDPTRHWETDEQTTTYGAGEPAWIETTALATHALLTAGARPDITGAALDWLISKKQPNGGWGSTAGTVWSIKCLLQALRASGDPAADATVRVRLDGIERALFEVAPETSDVMRQADLTDWLTPGAEQQLEIAMEGEGALMFGVVQRHHVPWVDAPPAEGPLTIDVAYDRTRLAVDDTVEVQVTVTNNDITYADMVMVDLGIPPGFELVRDDLNGLVEEQVISRFEATERQLLLYFTAILPEQPEVFTFRLVARHPIQAQAPANRVYSYYNPDVGSSTEPVEFEVQ